MRTSENVNDLFAALAKAQLEMKPASKSKKNPFFKSTYADLPSVWEACREPLGKNGLSVIQTTITQEGSLFLVSRLCHTSGQWVESVMPIVLTKHDPQVMGSAITYLRRYSLCALVGVVTDDEIDDDGNLYSKSMDDNTKNNKHQENKDNVQEKKLTEKQYTWLMNMLGSDESIHSQFLSYINNNYGVKKITDITPDIFNSVISDIKTKKFVRGAA